MHEFVESSVYFGVILSLTAYAIGMYLHSKFKLALLNPLLISIFFIIGFLLITGIDYEIYQEGARYISYLLTPATVCLAIPLYEQLELLKKNYKAILIGIIAGVLSSLGSILAMAFLFDLNHQQYVTLLPKSITTAIGMGVSEELGGYVTLTVAVIVITGILGNILAVQACRLFHIEEPIAKGVAIGT
ncbi:MAG: LrgB family protein, partial [Clostridiales bacterium]|nr:LrgB family protein [Clostridiales bacterium]